MLWERKKAEQEKDGILNHKKEFHKERTRVRGEITDERHEKGREVTISSLRDYLPYA